MSNSPFKSGPKNELLSLGHLTAVEETLSLPNGRDKKHYTIEHPGAVAILPIFSQSEIVFVRQYRHSINRWILELPAGTLDKNEDIAECARRELREETGFHPATLLPLGLLYPAPGFCSEVQHGFIATDLSTAEAACDEDEVIEVVRLAPSEVLERMRDESFFDGKTLALLFLASVKYPDLLKLSALS